MQRRLQIQSAWQDFPLPQPWNGPALNDSMEYVICHALGKFRLLEVKAGPFIICYTQYQFSRRSRIEICLDTPCIGIHFTLQHAAPFLQTMVPRKLNVSNECSIDYLRNTLVIRKLAAGPARTEFDIFLPLSYLAAYAAFHPVIAKLVDEEIDRGIKPGKTVPQQAGAGLIHIIQQMLYHPFHAPTHILYLKAKAQELLLMCLHEQSNRSRQQQRIHRDDLERIHEAAAIIRGNLHNPYSLLALARKVGINDCKLKRLFKQVYGRTVFQYVMEAKMGHARKLLMEKDLAIADISSLTGFKNVANFYEAFRKKFGCTPGYTRRNG